MAIVSVALAQESTLRIAKTPDARVGFGARRSVVAFVAAAALLSLAACGGGSRSERVNLPPTPILTVRSTWAVVTSPLLRIREDPENKATVLSHIRLGAIVEVIAKSDKEDTVENETAYWYRVNYSGLKGWVFGSYIEVFDSKTKAEKFAETVK